MMRLGWGLKSTLGFHLMLRFIIVNDNKNVLQKFFSNEKYNQLVRSERVTDSL